MQFEKFCIEHCDGEKDRRYFYINENSLEWNEPSSCAIFCPGIPFVTGQNPLGCYQAFAVPPNPCCPGADNITKVYFDRGMFDRQNCCFSSGCLDGIPKMHPNEIDYMCCCMKLPDWYSECVACYWPSMCGERVRFLPFTSFCCGCCNTEANWMTNFCSLCGPADGMPDTKCLLPVRTGLKVGTDGSKGEADLFTAAFEAAYLDWGETSGYLDKQGLTDDLMKLYGA